MCCGQAMRWRAVGTAARGDHKIGDGKQPRRKGTTMNATIYHNPRCGTSRNTLAILRHAGIEPTVIEYLKTPPDRSTLVRLLTDAGLTPREAVRQKEAPFKELGLGDPSVRDEAIIDAMLAHPILINRPIVVTERGTR